MKDPSKLSPSEIAEIGVRVTRAVLGVIERAVIYQPELAFEEVYAARTKKWALDIDRAAERACQDELHKRFGAKIVVPGEESLRKGSFDLSEEHRVVALVDPVDGTDLLERGLSNWCSAMIFFYPPQRKILGAFVGIPSVGVYYAIPSNGAYLQPLGAKGSQKLAGPSKVTTLKNASICFYGQKIKNFLSVASNPKFVRALRNLEIEKRVKFRLYNFGGNPMMVKLADGRVDAIVEVEGQHPHDVAPGAYIATQSGAAFTDLNGQPIDLVQSLLRPADPNFTLRYILTSTKKLNQEIRDYFQ